MSSDLVQSSFDYGTLDLETRVVVQQKTSEIKTLMKRAASDIIEIGQKLGEVKERLEHGAFGAWLENEFAWTERTAQRFMQVAGRFKSDTMSDLTIAPTALYILASPSTPDAAVEEVLTVAREGVEVTPALVREVVADYKPAPTPAARPAMSNQPIQSAGTPSTEFKEAFQSAKTTFVEEIEELEKKAEPVQEVVSVQEEIIPTDTVQNAFGCASCEWHNTGFGDLLNFECNYLNRKHPLELRRAIGAKCDYYGCGVPPLWRERLAVLQVRKKTPLAALMVTPQEVRDFVRLSITKFGEKALNLVGDSEYNIARWQEIQKQALELMGERK